MTSEPINKFIVEQLADKGVNILSVFNGRLLVSEYGRSQLFIYSCEGCYISAFATQENDELCDATWTPRGNIVYTTDSKQVVVISDSGEVISTYTHKRVPCYLSVPNDGIIYLTDKETGVYQSVDEGVTWSRVFKPTDGWHSEQMVNITTEHNDEFWTLETNDNCSAHLQVYSKDRRRSHSKVASRNINVTITGGKKIYLSSNSCLSYDGYMNIMVSDIDKKAVHVFSVHDQYLCQLLTSHHFNDEPLRLAIDKERQLLYVGQYGGQVGVFRLQYGDD